MDIASPVSLRTSGKRNNKKIASALWFALVVHVIAWFYWEPIQKITAPEIPDWVNIRLVAGFEEPQIEPEPQVKPVKPSKPKPVPVKQPEKRPIAKPQEKIAEVEQAEDIPEPAVEKEVKPAAASTFVQADSRPFALDNPKPVYPSAARRRGMQGVVLLQVNVSDAGNVTGIHIMRSSGFRVLDIAAINSVKQWRFMPARQGDEKVASTVQVPIRFVLNNS